MKAKPFPKRDYKKKIFYLSVFDSWTDNFTVFTVINSFQIAQFLNMPLKFSLTNVFNFYD